MDSSHITLTQHGYVAAVSAVKNRRVLKRQQKQDSDCLSELYHHVTYDAVHDLSVNICNTNLKGRTTDATTANKYSIATYANK